METITSFYGIKYPNNSTEVIKSTVQTVGRLKTNLRTNFKRTKDITKSTMKAVTFQLYVDIDSIKFKKLDSSLRVLKFQDNIAYEYIDGFKTGRCIKKEGKFFVVYSKHEDILFRHINSRYSKDALLGMDANHL